MAFAKGTELVIARVEAGGVSFEEVERVKDKRSAPLCQLPFVKQSLTQRSDITSICFLCLAAPNSSQAPPPVVLACGYQSGSVRFFSSDGRMLLAPVLHNSPVRGFKVKTIERPREYVPLLSRYATSRISNTRSTVTNTLKMSAFCSLTTWS